MHKIVIYGITGGISSGKTTIVKYLENRGIPTFSCDENIQEIMNVDNSVINLLKNNFPNCVEREKVNKSCLREEALLKNKLDVLETIFHPLVRQNMEEFIEISKKKGAKKIALEVPLLFEKKMEGYFDIILLADCPVDVQLSRIEKNTQLTREMASTIMKRQMKREQKIEKADYVIDCTKSKEEVYQKIEEIVFK